MNRGSIDRRRVLLSLAAAALGAGRASAVPAAERGVASLPSHSPAEDVRALVKLQGSLDGRPGYTFTTGQVFRTKYGELATPLLGFARCQVRVFRPAGDGRYRCAKHNWMMSTDPVTGEFVTEHREPGTAEAQAAPSFVVRNTPMLYGPDGVRWLKIRTEPALVGAPFRLSWRRVGDEGWATTSHTLRTVQTGEHVGVETASTTHRFRWAELFADTPWTDCGVSDLLQVDDVREPARESQLLFVGDGRRVGGVDGLPPDFVRETERRFPGLLAELPDPDRA